MKAGKKTNAEAQRGGDAERTDRWPLVRLGDVCEELRGRIAVVEVPLSRYVTTDSLVKNLGGRVEAEALPPCGSLVAYRKGDLLLSNIRPYLRKLWLADCDGGCSSDVIVLRPCHELDGDYLRLALSQDGFFQYVMRDVSGTKMPRGKRDHILNFTLPLPPLATQRAIVARLDSALARAGALEKRFAAIAQNAELSFKASLNEEFAERTGGTGETSGTGGSSDSRYSSTSKDPSAPRKPWPLVRLGDVCERFQYGTAQKSSQTGLVPVLRMGNLQDGQIDFSDLVYTSNEKDIKEYALHDGDLLFNRTNSSDKVGKVSVFHDSRKCIFAGYLIRFRPSGFDSDYMAYLMNASVFRKWCQSVKSDAVNQSNISASKLADFTLPLPPIPVQRAIVSRLDAARKRADGIAALARQAAEAAANLRKALLKEAFE